MNAGNGFTENRYTIYGEGKKRGLAYIIVNEKFGANYENRTGAYSDYKNMKKVFKQLGFKLYPYKDKTASEIKNILNKASRRKDLHQRPAFVCVLSSHGNMTPIVKVKGQVKSLEQTVVGVDDKKVNLEELIDLFDNSVCAGLRDKPKMFFLQICRENVSEYSLRAGHDEGVSVRLSTNNIEIKEADTCGVDVADGSQYTELGTDCAREETEYDIYNNSYDTSDNEDTDTTDNESESDSEESYRDDHMTKDNTEVEHAELSDEASGGSNLKAENDKKANIKLTHTSSDEPDAEKRGIGTPIQIIEPVEIIAIPCNQDMVVVFASPSGKVAWRSTIDGGWFLHSFYKIIQAYIKNKEIKSISLLDVLTDVSRITAIDRVKKDHDRELKMVPVIYHRLIKDVYFRKVEKPSVSQRLKETLKQVL